MNIGCSDCKYRIFAAGLGANCIHCAHPNVCDRYRIFGPPLGPLVATPAWCPTLDNKHDRRPIAPEVATWLALIAVGGEQNGLPKKGQVAMLRWLQEKHALSEDQAIHSAALWLTCESSSILDVVRLTNPASWGVGDDDKDLATLWEAKLELTRVRREKRDFVRSLDNVVTIASGGGIRHANYLVLGEDEIVELIKDTERIAKTINVTADSLSEILRAIAAAL